MTNLSSRSKPSEVSRLSRDGRHHGGEVRIESENDALMSHPPEPSSANYGYGYGSPYGPAYGPPRMPTNGKATASLVTGVATLVLSLCPLIGLAGLVAVFLGVKARSEIGSSGGTQQGDGLALGGIVTGAIALAVGLTVLALIVIALVAGVSYDTGGEATSGTSL